MTPIRLKLNMHVILLASVIFFASCVDKSVEPEQKTIFELDVDLSYNTENTDHWIIASDSNGNVLAFSSFKSGDVVALTTDSKSFAEKITITHLRSDYYSFPDYDKQRFVIQSYTNISSGSKMILTRDSHETPAVASKLFDISFSNMPQGNHSDVSISSLKNRITSLSGYGFDYEVGLTEPNDDLFVSVTGFHEPRYLSTSLSEPTTYSFDFLSDFRSYDHVLSVNMTGEFLVSVRGLDQESLVPAGPKRGSHVLAGYTGLIGSDLLKVGFNEDYELYDTFWSIRMDNWDYFEYKKVGEPPNEESFKAPVASLSVKNYSIYNFEFTRDREFTYRSSNWNLSNLDDRLEPLIYWNVTGSATHNNSLPKVFPDSISQTYPMLNEELQKIRYSNTMFTESKDGHTYEDMIERIFLYRNVSIYKIEYLSSNR